MKRLPLKAISFLFVIYICTCIFIETQAQDISYKFERFELKDGLSQSSVNDIIQDDYGFLWFATDEGLNKYDGYNFEIYRKSFDNPTSISDNFIKCLHEDKEGNIWIGTLGSGICIFNPKKETFSCLSTKDSKLSNDVIYDFVEDEKSVWIATDNGLNRFSKFSNQFFQYFPQKDNLHAIPDSLINIIYQTSSGEIWIGTNNGGLCMYRPDIDGFNIYKHDIGNTGSISSNTVWGIAEDPILGEEVLWIATYRGLNRFDRHDNSFTCFKHNEDDINSLPNNRIRAMCVDNKNNIWLGTRGGGLSMLSQTNQSRQHFINFKANPCNENSLTNNDIISIYEDRTGQIWVGTKFGGLVKVSRNEFNHTYSGYGENGVLSSNAVNAMLKDSHGNLWVGTDKGLNLRKTNSKKYIHFFSDENNSNSLSDNSVLCLFEDREENIWIGTKLGGLNKYNPTNKQFTHYKPDENNTNSISSIEIKHIIERDSILWIATRTGGLNKFDPRTGIFKRYEETSSKKNCIASNRINALTFDKDGYLWIATSGSGLDRFNPETEYFKHYKKCENTGNSINDSYLMSLFIDNDSILWIGTYLGGLNKLNMNSQKFEYYTEADGLPNNVICAILKDNEDFLWLSTNYGISKFNKQTKEFLNFYESDGLQANEFIGMSCFKSPEGKLYFGGINGFNEFNPSYNKYFTTFPKVHVTKLFLFNKHIKPNENSILDKSIIATDTIHLGKDDYNFSLNFVAFNYPIQPKLYYSYKLEGFDNEWIQTNHNNRLASYTRLPSGEYTFRVKASSNPLIWSDTTTDLVIVVESDFLSNYFIWILIGGVLIVLFFHLYYLRSSSMKKQTKYLERIVEERTIELSVRAQEIELKNDELEQQKNEIEAQRDILSTRNNEILRKNKELEKSHEQLEKLVKLRTIDLENAKNKAEMADKIKTAFLSNMSHEIRTPMNGIIGFVNLLALPDISDEQRQSYINYINQSSKSLLQLIEDIIDISRLESGEIKMNIQTTVVKNILEDLYNMFEAEREQQNKEKLKLEYSIPVEKFSIQTDAQRLRQVMSNLLDNALKFTEEGFIKYGFEVKGSKVLFYVKDSGIGIPEDSLEVIFERFKKLHRSSDQLYRGTGLGLALTKKVVGLLGGKIWAESVVDAGSTFYFELPCKEERDKPEPIKVETTKTQAALENITILIAEDEETNYRYLEAALAKTKANLLWVQNGKLAVEAVKENPKVDLVLMDIKMPVMDGYQATVLIKRWNNKMPVIAQTAYAMMEDKNKCLAVGCDDFISKPIDIYGLVQKIKVLTS